MPSLQNLMRRVHDDERGAVSLETILIIGAIAMPILIFLLKFGWPKIKDLFDSGVKSLGTEVDNVSSGR